MTDWIAVKNRIESFLKDEAVLSLMADLEAKYIGEFKTAKKAEDLWRAHARLNAQDEFLSALRVGIGRGELAVIEAKKEKDKQK